VIPAPQANYKVMTSIGVEMNHESINICDIVTNEDGSLEFKTLEHFMDSKAELDSSQALKAAGVKK
jgi:hypothetical protein